MFWSWYISVLEAQVICGRVRLWSYIKLLCLHPSPWKFSGKVQTRASKWKQPWEKTLDYWLEFTAAKIPNVFESMIACTSLYDWSFESKRCSRLVNCSHKSLWLKDDNLPLELGDFIPNPEMKSLHYIYWYVIIQV